MRDPALTCGIEELLQHWGPTATRAAVCHALGEDPLRAAVREAVADLRGCRAAACEGVGTQIGDDLGRMAAALEAALGEGS